MSRLDRDPQVVQLAKELGLRGSGGWVAKIQSFARAQVEAVIEEAGIEVTSTEELLRVLADRLSVKIEYVYSDADIERIGGEYGFSEAEYRALCHDLNDPGTDGLLIINPASPRPGSREFLAAVDARGEHGSRAYFTAWHELAHLIVTPSQRAFVGFYRTISATRAKDPEESVVDAVAGELAFYEPLFRPVVERALRGQRQLTFDLVEEVRREIVPKASFYATAIAVVRIIDLPTLLVQVNPAHKAEEDRYLGSGQQELALGSAIPQILPKLRATDAIGNQAARDRDLRIFPNMRVPERSILAEIFHSMVDASGSRPEDQNWWETSSDGPLPPLPLRVEAMRRGPYVYGLIAPTV